MSARYSRTMRFPLYWNVHNCLHCIFSYNPFAVYYIILFVLRFLSQVIPHSYICKPPVSRTSLSLSVKCLVAVRRHYPQIASSVVCLVSVDVMYNHTSHVFRDLFILHGTPSLHYGKDDGSVLSHPLAFVSARPVSIASHLQAWFPFSLFMLFICWR